MQQAIVDRASYIRNEQKKNVGKTDSFYTRKATERSPL